MSGLLAQSSGFRTPSRELFSFDGEWAIPNLKYTFLSVSVCLLACLSACLSHSPSTLWTTHCFFPTLRSRFAIFAFSMSNVSRAFCSLRVTAPLCSSTMRGTVTCTNSSTLALSASNLSTCCFEPGVTRCILLGWWWLRGTAEGDRWTMCAMTQIQRRHRKG